MRESGPQAEVLSPHNGKRRLGSGAPVSTGCSPPRQAPTARRTRVYLGIWCRIDEEERIPHLVIAGSEAKANAISKAAMRGALGKNFDHWRLESVWLEGGAASEPSLVPDVPGDGLATALDRNSQ